MGVIHPPPPPAKLFCGIIRRPNLPLPEILPPLLGAFGPPDFESEALDFSAFTDYYESEMGNGLLRHFVSFERLVERTRLPEIKRTAKALEDAFAEHGRRRVNLDPGLLTLGQIFLASTKDNFSRVYLDQGIYAEITLYYKEGRYENNPWTYRDYQSEAYKEILLKMRGIYKAQLDSQGDRVKPGNSPAGGRP